MNADGLPGFISKFDILKHLIDADEAGQLEHTKKHQVVDMRTIQEKLESQESQELKMNFLSEEYPSLFVFILEHFNM